MTTRPVMGAAAGRGRTPAVEGVSLVEGEGLTVVLGGRTIVERVDIVLRPGEIVTVVGPNGAGKTTLIKALIGLIEPTKGVVRRASNLTVGYLPQRLTIDTALPLTVRRLMTLTGRLAKPQLEGALGETGVAHLIDASVHRLSGGELQRVLLARALARDPHLLVLDEPVQGVDYAGEAALYELIAELRDRRGCGILMVSHDLHLVMAATNRVLCLNRHICCSGSPETVAHHPEYVRLFGPRAAGAIALYSHRHDHHHGLGGEVVADIGSEPSSPPSRR